MKRKRDNTKISFLKLFTTAHTFYETEALQVLNGKIVKTPFENYVASSQKKKEYVGDKRMAMLKYLLDYIPGCNGWVRSSTQKLFHRNFLQAACLNIYKDDPSIDMKAIMKRNRFRNLKQQILCLTPRRFGKSTSVAMFIAAYAIACPGSKQCVYSTGRRASQLLLELIRDLIKKGKYADRILKCNQETLVIKGDAPNDLRIINSYPSCSRTLRGTGGDLIYMEEAAFMSLDVFFEVVLPLLEMSTTCLIAISTPLNGLNFYSELFELTGPTGDNLFNTLKIGLSCEKCQKLGKSAECNHMKHLIPSWKSASKFDLVKAVYADRKDLLARESMGQITSDNASVFSQKSIDLFMDRKPYKMKNKPDFVFLGVDPNGGGTSELSVVSICMEQNQIIILGIDSYPAKSHKDIKTVLIAHVNAIRCHPLTNESWCIFFPENNLGQEASHMQHMCKDIRKFYTYHEKEKPGVCTTHERKEKYTVNTVQYFNQGAIHFDENFICANPFYSAETRTNRVQKELRKQLIQFQKVVVPAAQPYQLAKYFFTGKLKPGMNDDCVMTLLFTIYWAQQFVNKKILVPYEKFVR
jgi:hypothetical protein